MIFFFFFFEIMSVNHGKVIHFVFLKIDTFLQPLQGCFITKFRKWTVQSSSTLVETDTSKKKKNLKNESTYR